MLVSCFSSPKALGSIALALLASLPIAAQTVHRVDDGANGSNDGSSWADAFVDLQDALAIAGGGDQIWVATGTYRPAPPSGDRGLSFDLKAGVEIYGGFDGTEVLLTSRAGLFDQTLLTGDLNGDDLPGFANNGENSYSVVHGPAGTDATAVLDGFTITAGNGNGGSAEGGGMLSEGGAAVGPTIRNCAFLANSAGSGGGLANVLVGLAIGPGSSPTLTDCEFRGNRATGGQGGGIWNDDASTPTLVDCVFDGNESAIGGGLAANGASHTTLIDCTFVDNTATAFGGAVALRSGSRLDARGCRFEGNAAATGGGIDTFDFLSTGGDLTLVDCEFVGNTAMGGAGGGGISTRTGVALTGCTFSGNVAEGGGGGLSASPGVVVLGTASVTNCVFSGNRATSGTGSAAHLSIPATVTNCTFSGNVVDVSGAAVFSGPPQGDATLINCILWGNSDSAGAGESAQVQGGVLVDVDFSCIQGFQAPRPGTVLGEQKVSGSQGGFMGTIDGDQFGGALAPLGDLDGDSVPDLAVGAWRDLTMTGLGAVWILLLNADGTVKAEQKINDVVGGFSGPLDVFGYCLAAPASPNGIADLAVGAPGDDVDRGAVWLLSLNANGTVASQSRISHTFGGFVPEPDESQLGAFSVAWIGDLDGDGFEDLAVGSPTPYDYGVQIGEENKVWILFLDGSGSVQAQQRISETQGGFLGSLDEADEFGISMALIGDLEGDGLPELAVGAPGDDDGGIDRGAIWILSLDTDGTVAAERKISSTAGAFGGTLTDGARFGGSLTGMGDFDGDGVPDLLAGSAPDDAFWVLFLNADGTVKGQELIDATNGCLMSDVASGDSFGGSLAVLGDLDGDGVSDAAVGAPRDDSTAGAVWSLFLNLDQPTCVNPDGLGGTGNLGSDPLFVNASGPDLVAGTADDNVRLAFGSPCIDVGDGAALPADTEDLDADLDVFEPLPEDIAGSVRVLDGDGDSASIVDLGAHEFPVTVVDTDLDSFETIVLEPEGSSGDPTLDAAVTASNTSVSDDATISVSETPVNVHPEAGGFSTPGTTLIVETTLADGEFFMTLSIPFDAADLAGSDPLDVELSYYDTLVNDWVLAVLANTQNSPGFPGPEGDYFQVTGAIPSIPTLDLGDHGVFWNPTTMVGFAWANVDHTTAFATDLFQDCNANGVPDPLEADCDGDGLPDACALAEGLDSDCNQNGIPDSCDIASGTSRDKLGTFARGPRGVIVSAPNGVPDECELDLIPPVLFVK